jgi:hypothetical protein
MTLFDEIMIIKIFNIAAQVHQIYDLNPLSLYKIDNTNNSQNNSIYPIQLEDGNYNVLPLFDEPICTKWYNHMLQNKDNLFEYYSFRYKYKLETNADNLRKIIISSARLRSATCFDYSVLMCSILNQELPKEYSKTLQIRYSEKDSHVVLFIDIDNVKFVIDLWAKYFIKNKSGLICCYEDYIKSATASKFMKHFEFSEGPISTEQSKALDLRFLLNTPR